MRNRTLPLSLMNRHSSPPGAWPIWIIEVKARYFDHSIPIWSTSPKPPVFSGSWPAYSFSAKTLAAPIIRGRGTWRRISGRLLHCCWDQYRLVRVAGPAAHFPATGPGSRPRTSAIWNASRVCSPTITPAACSATASAAPPCWARWVFRRRVPSTASAPRFAAHANRATTPAGWRATSSVCDGSATTQAERLAVVQRETGRGEANIAKTASPTNVRAEITKNGSW